jgi:type VI secretion system protein ImpC
MFVVNRLAHYIKVLQRENIGSWKDKNELNRELNQWIRQYVSDQENPSVEVRSLRPLRAAQITVEDVEGDPGWYRVSMAVRPHFKYMGANFTLSLVGKLDKS